MVLRSVGAYAVRRSDPSEPLLADSVDTLHKVIALKWIGEWVPSSDAVAEPIRQAILDERWADAVFGWMEATREVVDVFPFGPDIHQSQDYPDDEFGLRIQVTRLFRPR
jgi:hypothetical protein